MPTVFAPKIPYPMSACPLIRHGWLILVLVFSPLLRAQDPEKLESLFQAGDYVGARTVVARLIEREPQEPVHRYNLACAEARLGFSELALDALEAALRLGYTNRQLLLEDPDLASVRDKRRFQALVQRLPAAVAAAPAAPKAPNPPPAAPRPEPARNPTALAMPVEPRLTADGPVGLYFMTRFWMSSGLEQKLWYFDPAGRAYLSPGSSFTVEALERDSARRGRRSMVGEKLKVEWSDGKVSESNYKVDSAQTGFSWDAGIFSAVPRPDWTNVAGYFEGGASFSNVSGGGTSVSALTLRADGTFAWSRGASIRGETTASTAIAGSAGGPRKGSWTGAGYQMTLTFDDGQIERFVAFPMTNPKDRSQVDMLFFNGSMHLAKQR